MFIKRKDKFLTNSSGGPYKSNSQHMVPLFLMELIIVFSSNVNPLGISRKVLTKLQKDLPRLSLNYPDPESLDLKKSLVHYMNERISCDQISVGNGATEIIDIFAKTFGKKE